MKFKPTKKPTQHFVKPRFKQAQPLPLLFGEKVFAVPFFRLKKILVPVDFTSCSDKALQYAIPFARQFDAELTLLHVVEAASRMSDLAVMEVESLDDANRALETIHRKLDDVVRSSLVVRTGSPGHEIIEAARELKADLIILSTHGRTGLERFFMGSTAEKVVRHAGCPVLIVRENEHEFIGGGLIALQASRMTPEAAAPPE
jgi:universal stress protein A